MLGAAAIGVVVAVGGGDDGAAPGRPRAARPHDRPRPPRRRRSRRSPACPTRRRQRQTRPVLIVKVENTPDARPQVGHRPADVVYEEVVEGKITRFLAMFQSTAPETSARSARCACTTRSSCGRSAGSSPTRAARRTRSTRSTPRRCTRSTTTPRSRRRERHGARRSRTAVAQAPHNLFGHGPRCSALGGKPAPPPPLFQYLSTGRAAPEGSDPGEPVVRCDSASAAATTSTTRGTRRRARGCGSSHDEPHVVGRRRRRSRRRTSWSPFTYYGGVVERGRRSARATRACSPTGGCAGDGGSAPTASSRRSTSTRTASRSVCAPGAPGSSCPADYPVDVDDTDTAPPVRRPVVL